MRNKIIELGRDFEIHELYLDAFADRILSLLGENTEGVSDASHKSGVLHDVGESHASGQTDNDSLASGELPLEKITEAKESEFGFSIDVVPASWLPRGKAQILCHPDDLPNFDG